MDHEDDDTVSFNLKDTWHFNQEESGSLTGDEIVTIPNVLLLVRSVVLCVSPDARLLTQSTDWNLILFIHPKSATLKHAIVIQQ